MRNYLPSWVRATSLAEHYLEQAPWFAGIVTSQQLQKEILQPIFFGDNFFSPGGSAPPVLSTSSGLSSLTNQPTNTPHILGLAFMVFCFGALADPSLPQFPNSPEADRYFQLGKACMTLEPILTGPPNVASVQALSLISMYQVGVLTSDSYMILAT